MALVNWGEVRKQLFNPTGDYDLSGDVSVSGGERSPQKTTLPNGQQVSLGIGNQNTPSVSGGGSQQRPSNSGFVNGATTNTPTKVGSPAPASGGGASPALNTAAIGATQKAIDSLGTEQEIGMRNIDDSYGSVISKYDREAGQARGDYEGQTVTNNQNLQKNKQNALLAAAQGRRGLRGTLSSLGALSGDGSALADRAVTQGANADIGEAADTFAGNQVNLDKALEGFSREDEDRRREAETARNNQRTATEGQVLSKRQQMLQQLAQLFGEGGNNARAGELLNEAGNLNGAIAQRTAVQATPFNARSAAFTPGSLEDYLAGAGDMTVDVAEGGDAGAASPTSILAGRNRRRDREAAAI